MPFPKHYSARMKELHIELMTGDCSGIGTL